MFFFESGTNTQLETFADELQTIPNSHPVLCDAAGNTPNIFYDGSAKLVVLDENDVQYLERDPVGGGRYHLGPRNGLFRDRRAWGLSSWNVARVPTLGHCRGLGLDR